MGNFSFENQGMNTFLVYSADDEINFDTLSLGMLTNNKIEGLLPVVYSQLDTTKFLRYNITSKISLQQYFQGTIKRDQFVKIFFSLTKTMMTVREYMIPEQSIILDTDRIYVDVSDGSASMVCLPILNKNSFVDLAAFLKNIMFSITFDETQDSSYVTKVINYLNGTNNLNLKEFESVLLELARDRDSGNLKAHVICDGVSSNSGTQNGITTNNGIQNGIASDNGTQSGITTNNGVQNGMPTNGKNMNNGVQNGVQVNNGNIIQSNPGQQSVPANQNNGRVQPNKNASIQSGNVDKRGKIWPFGGGKKKNTTSQPVKPTTLTQPKKKNSKPIIGMEIPGISGQNNNGQNGLGDMKIPGQKVEFNQNPYVKNNIPANQPVQTPQRPMQTSQQQMKPPQQLVRTPQQLVQMPQQPVQMPQQPVQTPQQPVQPPQQPVQMPQQPVQQQVTNNANSSIPQGVNITSGMAQQVKPGETVELSSLNYQESLRPTLIRVRNNQRITINQAILRIGREEGFVDYCVNDNMAIGRCHASISSRDNQYFIVDNNSKNHTYVDGRMVEAGKEYPLSSGVKIMLANEEFEFKFM